MDAAPKIVRIWNHKTGTDVNLDHVSIEDIAHKYSNTKQPIKKFVIHGTSVSKNNDYRAEYICNHCDRVNIVALNNLIRRIRNNVTQCNMCKNADETKRNHQSEWMHKNRFSLGEKISQPEPATRRISDTIQDNNTEFESIPREIQLQYYKKYLTKQEFDQVRHKIVSIQHDKFKADDIKDWEYCPTVRLGTNRFFPYLYDPKRDVIEKITYIKWVCDQCRDCFVNRDLYVQKNRIRILCRDCSFCNRIFKLKSYLNCNKKPVLYQSRQERKLIEFCNQNNLEILNGHTIPYNWNNTVHKYRIDFFIPSKGFLIELKDNHIWHKKQVESGKWAAKEKAAQDFSIQNKYIYEVVFPHQIKDLCERLLMTDEKI